MTNFPLQWPAGWRRTNRGDRQDGRFSHNQRHLTINDGVCRVNHAVALLMKRMSYELIISTNLRVRNDGLPYSQQRDPDNQGVAVYWKRTRDQIHKVLAVDQYKHIADNLAAVAATLECIRGIERYGGSTIMERAFMGFLALPSPNDWRHVMGFEDTPEWNIVDARYTELAKQRHPDCGGSEEVFKELGRAFADAKRELCATA